MNTMFMSSKNSKISDPHKLLLSLTEKKDLRKKDKHITISNLSIYYMEKYKQVK